MLLGMLSDYITPAPLRDCYATICEALFVALLEEVLRAARSLTRVLYLKSIIS